MACSIYICGGMNIKMLMKNYSVAKAKIQDVSAIAEIYDEVNDWFSQNINFNLPDWIKGSYPIINDAINAIEEDSLFVLKLEEKTLGSVIINHKQLYDYPLISWGIDAEPKDVFSMHTLVIKPNYREKGLGKILVKYAIKHCRNEGAKTIRLDTYKANIPAQKLYKSCGFNHITDWTTTKLKANICVFEYIF